MRLRAEKGRSGPGHRDREPWDASAKTLFYAIHNMGEQLRISEARKRDGRPERMEGR